MKRRTGFCSPPKWNNSNFIVMKGFIAGIFKFIFGVVKAIFGVILLVAAICVGQTPD